MITKFLDQVGHKGVLQLVSCRGHAQRLIGYGEVGEPITKDKNFNNMPKCEKSLKSIGSIKHKRPTKVEHSVKAARIETTKQVSCSSCCRRFRCLSTYITHPRLCDRSKRVCCSCNYYKNCCQ